MKPKRTINLALFAVLVFSLSSFAQIKPGRAIPRLAKTSAGLPYVLMNANNVTCWVRSDGFFPALVKRSFNGEFLKGSGVGTVYQEGIVFGGFVTDGLFTNSLRVTGDTYFIGMQSGAIQSDASGNTTGADDPTLLTSRAFAVRPDMPPSLAGDTARWPDLRWDAATFLQKSVDSVTFADEQQIANQYFQDWMEWPATKGAPWFVDNVEIVRNDAAFDPTNPHDIPGIPIAAKTIWFVCNDLSQTVSAQFAFSPPIGIEEQMTLWAYRDSSFNDALNNVIFKQVKLIYKGNPGAPSNSRIDTMYVAQWADPEVGFYGDDYAGCDSLLSLGYAYNSRTFDSLYNGVGFAAPAMGYAVLQGSSRHTGNLADSAVIDFQWRRGYKYWHNLPMTVFDYRAPGYPPTTITDDNYGGSYNETEQWYNQLRGFFPNPSYPFGSRYCDNSTYAKNHNIATLYAIPGDPTVNQGWIDGLDVQTGDRRILCSHGPITLNLHDTAEVVIALIDGLGASNLWSVQILKYYTSIAKYSFYGFVNPSNIAVSASSSPIPISYEVSQNYPNPFNPSTTIRYQIPALSRVLIRIYNLLGQEVATLVDEQKKAGVYSIEWNALNVPSGVYFYRTEVVALLGKASTFRDAKKMILLK